VTPVQIVNSILVLHLACARWACAMWIAQFQIQRMPTHQRAALEQFARMAVRYVEQVHVDSHRTKKRSPWPTRPISSGSLACLYHLRDVIEVAIGAAAYEIRDQE
jgi:hypothetical protein